VKKELTIARTELLITRAAVAIARQRGEAISLPPPATAAQRRRCVTPYIAIGIEQMRGERTAPLDGL
jgi:hypothetical protein